MDIDEKDPILDSLLDEVITGRAPPDLTARILQAWAARRYGQDSSAQQFSPEQEPAAPPILLSVKVALDQPIAGGNGAVAAASAAKSELRGSGSWSAALTVGLAAGVIGLGLTIGLVALRPSPRPQIVQNVEPIASEPAAAPANIARAKKPPEPRVEPEPVEKSPAPETPQVA